MFSLIHICVLSNSCPFKQHLFRRLLLVKTELVEIKLHCDSIITRSYITRSPRGFQIYFQYKYIYLYCLHDLEIYIHMLQSKRTTMKRK